MLSLVDLKASGTRYRYEEIINFIKKHGENVFEGDLKELDDEIDRFAQEKRLFLLRDKSDRLVAVACCNNIDSNRVENPDGRILFVHGIVIHSAIRHKNIMSQMLKKWMILFPKIEYIMFQRYKKPGEFKVMPASKILRRK